MRYVYKLEHLGCANCAAKMETAINKIDGIDSAKVTFMTAKLTVDADESLIGSLEEKIDKAIRKIESQVRMKRV